MGFIADFMKVVPQIAGVAGAIGGTGGAGAIGGNLPMGQAAGAGAGGFNFGDLLKNKLFLQYMAAAGQDLSQGKPLGANVNATTLQNIGSQNFAKLMGIFPGGNIPKDGKIELTADGAKINVPTSALTSGQEQGTGTTSQINPSQLAQVNPFATSQPNVTASDLAGLTTEDLSRALGLQLGSAELKQRTMRDMMEFQAAMANAAKGPKPTSDIQNYEYARSQGYKGTFDEFTAEKTSLMKEYDTAVNQGYSGTFEEYAKEMKRAGATNISIGEKQREKLEMGKIQGQLYFSDPKWTDDLNKYLQSDTVQSKFMSLPGKGEEYNANLKKAKSVEKARWVEGKIAAGGGQVIKVDISKDGIGTWIVQWPSGDTETITYAIND